MHLLLQHWSPVAIPLCAVVVAVAVFAGGFWLMARAQPPVVATARVMPREELVCNGPNREESWSRAPAAPSSRRSAVPVLLSDAEAEADPIPARVVERSIHRLFLEVAQDGTVEVGDVLAIQPCCADATVPWIQVRVLNYRPLEAGSELECHFVRTPIWSVRALLGMGR